MPQQQNMTKKASVEFPESRTKKNFPAYVINPAPRCLKHSFEISKSLKLL
jgi:hypothetical protein